MYSLNETHNPDRYSWVATANDPATDFPLQNLPFGIFRPKGSDEAGRVGVAIGTQIVDVGACHREGVFLGEAAVAADACSGDTLNPLLALAPAQWSALRRRLSEILAAGQRESAQYQSVVAPCLVPQAEVEMLMPIHVGDYTDFYASVHHATNVGRMLRPDGPLLPNYKYVPIGYHGRASSVVVSGTDIRRPAGQVLIYPGLGGDIGKGSYVEHANAPLLGLQDILNFRGIRSAGAIEDGDVTQWPLADDDFAELPPTVIITAQCDPLSSDGEVYRDRILAAGGKAYWKEEAGLVHGYLRARRTVDRARDSFERIVEAVAELGRGEWPY